MFAKILIANRGEIACRIIRTARAMGIATVAIYSEADAGAAHVAAADEAFCVGPAPSRESYLRGEAIIGIARASGAQAVHPGYGFLSENAEFAQGCVDAGLVFIGPPAAAIRAMGGKSQAKALMERAGVPLVPGYHGENQESGALAAQAAKIGYPVLIKASAGGGGRGMRVVEEAGDFADALAAAQREAASSFGDARVLIEKYFSAPRHVEMQIFADAHGNCIHLFERDCSIQRRHQKIIEEAPAPGMNAALRQRMGEAAIAAARAVNYQGAGTIEFLFDGGGFYFMEMNTRLQVEHPVTEFITGLDLVEWQFRIAAGERLPKSQEQICINGHAIEVRVCAEDPAQNFRPAAGTLKHLRFPGAGPHVRVDSGVREGDGISVFYDPMIAKLIVWDTDRAAAIARLRTALAGTEIAGLATNVALLSAIAVHPAFAGAELDTGFLTRHAEALHASPALSETALALAALGLLLHRRAAADAAAVQSPDPHSPFARLTGWRLNEPARDSLQLRHGETDIRLDFRYDGAGFLLLLPSGPLLAAGTLASDGSLRATIGPATFHARFVLDHHELTLFHAGAAEKLQLVDPLPAEEAETAAGGVTAPMPGTITAIITSPGAHVAKGERLVVMEAMKMEFALTAPADGVVSRLPFAVGTLVPEGAALVEFEPG
jgi:3-methylcrotonyl-CoA carboxylase alpha subunit